MRRRRHHSSRCCLSLRLLGVGATSVAPKGAAPLKGHDYRGDYRGPGHWLPPVIVLVLTFELLVSLAVLLIEIALDLPAFVVVLLLDLVQSFLITWISGI